MMWMKSKVVGGGGEVEEEGMVRKIWEQSVYIEM